MPTLDFATSELGQDAGVIAKRLRSIMGDKFDEVTIRGEKVVIGIPEGAAITRRQIVDAVQAQKPLGGSVDREKIEANGTDSASIVLSDERLAKKNDIYVEVFYAGERVKGVYANRQQVPVSDAKAEIEFSTRHAGEYQFTFTLTDETIDPFRLTIWAVQ